MDLSWDYPGVYVQGASLVLILNKVYALNQVFHTAPVTDSVSLVRMPANSVALSTLAGLEGSTGRTLAAGSRSRSRRGFTSSSVVNS